MGLIGGISPSRVPAPRIMKSRNGAFHVEVFKGDDGSEDVSQLPAENVAVLRGSLPPRKSLEQLDRLSLASPPLQSTELAGTSSSKHTRGQSRETGSLSTLSGSVEASAKCVSMGTAHCSKRVQDLVWVASASIQHGVSHSGGPQAGSGKGTSRHSLEEGGH